MTAAETAAVAAELDVELDGAVVRDVARLDANDDLIAFLERGDFRRALHVALGSGRARVCTTRRRFAGHEFASGPLVDRLGELLAGATWRAAVPAAGERRLTLAFARPDGVEVTIEVELFGNRGLWALCCDGVIEELSRLPNLRDRELRRGLAYTPPPPPPPPGTTDGALRFVAPIGPAIDEFYTALDVHAAAAAEQELVHGALVRAIKRSRDQLDGLERQRHAMEGAAELRIHADLLLAYGYGVAPNQTELVAPDPGGGADIAIPLRQGVPIHAQAEALYRRARKYEDGRRHATERVAAARARLDQLQALAAEPLDDAGATGRVRARLVELGVLPPPRSERQRSAAPLDKRQRDAVREGFRRFVSAEGLPIWVGRNNAQNDRLSIRVARGNDLWFHVGRGYAGSHVVVRLDKNRNASLETLLDAATLAVHFSKVRGAELCEVIHTRAKNVSKPKGLPPGKVVATHTKEMRIKRDPARLARLLGADPA